MAHINTLFQRPDKISKPLYVITTVFNSPRYRSRWKLYEDFCLSCENTGAILYTVEIAFGEREFAVTQPDNPRHLQLRTHHELWYKENAINLGVQRLPQDWSYVAWVDADTHFVRSDWADETIHALQHWPVVQMWTQMHDLDSDYNLKGTIRSFIDWWVNGNPEKTIHTIKTGYPYPYPYPGIERKPFYPGAPGLAWAMRREAWDQLGGLIDYCILGAGDSYMAYALIGHLDYYLQRKYHPRFTARLFEWENRAKQSLWQERAICGNVGVVKGVCLHHWHGSKAERHYSTRENILVKCQFNPDTDLKRDWQGLYVLSDRSPQLRRDVQRYFLERKEDAL